MKNNDAYILLTYIIHPEDGQYAAYCRELGTASCGDTVEEARALSLQDHRQRRHPFHDGDQRRMDTIPCRGAMTLSGDCV